MRFLIFVDIYMIMHDPSGGMEGCIKSDHGYSSDEWASSLVAECLAFARAQLKVRKQLAGQCGERLSRVDPFE